MTIQEFYDGLTDEDVVKALTYEGCFEAARYSHAKITGEPAGLLDGIVQSQLEKQATKRWLKIKANEA